MSTHHRLNVLVACEFSGVVREAFTQLGHYAVSCDLEPTEIPGNHYQGDVRQLLELNWDIMIAHPPCRYLARSGSRWWSTRQKEMSEALEFVQLLLDANIPRIALENPVGAISTHIRKPDQYIQPWQFGHGEVKKTGLWLKNLQPLQPTCIVDGREERIHHMPPSPTRSKDRSRTYTGIALAMAMQWGVLA